MKKTVLKLTLACTPILLCAADTSEDTSAKKPSRFLPLSLNGFIEPQNIERPQPIIQDAIDLERRETLSGKTYSELMHNAHKKGLPLMLIATRKITLSGDVINLVMDYLDGYTILDNTPSSSSSLHDRVHDFLQEKGINWQCIAMCSRVLLAYPNTAHLKALSGHDYLWGTVDDKPFDERESVANIYCNHNSPNTSEILKLTKAYLDFIHKITDEPNVDSKELKRIATIFTFWANQLDLTKHPDLDVSVQSMNACLAENSDA